MFLNSTGYFYMHVISLSRIFFGVLASILLVSAPAFAEKADRTKPINIEAKRGTIDEANKVRTIEGDVILIQGTMRIAAERMVVKEDTTGNISAQAFGSAAGQITFKQKREGFSDFVDGVADRAEFDDKANTLKLFGRARLSSAGDVAEGEYIYFNTATEVYAIRNSAADDKPGVIQTDTSGRVKITIQPRVRESTETKSSTDAAKEVSAPK
jgi:lipopolysaccharide export system protein LptA